MILVTGATGFVGSAIVKELCSNGKFDVLAAVRHDPQSIASAARCIRVGDLQANTQWAHALGGVSVVVHTAARVHVVHDAVTDPMTEFRRVNVAGTINLAMQAAAAGVRRFVFISSVKVNGEQTLAGHPFSAQDEPAPVDPYGISKMEAERLLREVGLKTGMEIVIIRPPLVYGPGVKANFRAMLCWLRRGLPLPLGAIENRRSLAALDNLVGLVGTCLHHPAAANQTLLVSDDDDISTTQLLRRLSRLLGVPARLIPVPPLLLRAGACLVGRQGVAQRLCGSLQVDVAKTRELLGWVPAVSLNEGLRKTVDGFLHEAHR